MYFLLGSFALALVYTREFQKSKQLFELFFFFSELFTFLRFALASVYTQEPEKSKQIFEIYFDMRTGLCYTKCKDMERRG